MSVQRPPGAQPRFAVRPDGRSMEQDLVLLADKLAENERLLRNDIENKIQNHRRWNQNHIDLTKDPLSPAKEQGAELKFRPAKTQYLMTPPASVSSDSMDVDEDGPEPMDVDKPRAPVFQFKAGGQSTEPLQTSQPAFRRRIGRLSRLWIDRRGMATPPRAEMDGQSDRWKYDSDSDDEEPHVYEVDPFDTRALKFRSTIALNPYVFRGRMSVPPDAANAVSGANRALPPPPQPAAAPAQATPAAS